MCLARGRLTVSKDCAFWRKKCAMGIRCLYWSLSSGHVKNLPLKPNKDLSTIFDATRLSKICHMMVMMDVVVKEVRELYIVGGAHKHVKAFFEKTLVVNLTS